MVGIQGMIERLLSVFSKFKYTLFFVSLLSLLDSYRYVRGLSFSHNNSRIYICVLHTDACEGRSQESVSRPGNVPCSSCELIYLYVL